jgi:hypothetical protein|tara:strand:+ start:87 stop:398 length:312 start_codon:yes stop_codon:yes gene_type:complete
MKGLFRAVFDKQAYFPKDQFFIKYYKDFEKLEPDEKCRIIEEIQFHLQKEYDRNRKLADREYSTTNNEGHWDYRSSYRVDEILYDKKRPIEVSENLKRYNSNK